MPSMTYKKVFLLLFLLKAISLTYLFFISLKIVSSSEKYDIIVLYKIKIQFYRWIMDFQVFIITGLSGAGKSQSLRILEDLGFFCVDNIPPKLVPTLIDLCLATNGKISGLAVVIDIRTENFLEDFKEMVNTINSKNIPFKILFLEADDEVIVKRYNETRRIHPLLREGKTILESIRLEKERLQEIKTFATDIIDT